MKTASVDLVDYLESATQLIMADCYTVTLRDGTALHYTTADVNVTLGGNTFLANSVRVGGLKYKIAIGVDVDEQDITIAATAADLVDGVPFLAALREGVFDGAYIQRDRAFLSGWQQAAIGSVTLFHGRISTIDKIGRSTAQIKVKSDLVLLDIDMPRNLWGLGCLHTLYDAGCGLAKTGFQTSGSVGAGSTNQIVNWTGATDNSFAQGVILFTAGENTGVSTTLRASGNGLLTLSYPLDAAPQTGDAFTIWKGCDKTLATCQSRFNNKPNFRGYPFVPPPEMAY